MLVIYTQFGVEFSFRIPYEVKLNPEIFLALFYVLLSPYFESAPIFLGQFHLGVVFSMMMSKKYFICSIMLQGWAILIQDFTVSLEVPARKPIFISSELSSYSWACWQYSIIFYSELPRSRNLYWQIFWKTRYLVRWMLFFKYKPLVGGKSRFNFWEGSTGIVRSWGLMFQF